jgi:hypothetical protein
MDFSKLMNTIITIPIHWNYKSSLKHKGNYIARRVKNGRVLLSSITRSHLLEETTEHQLFLKFMIITNIIRK